MSKVLFACVAGVVAGSVATALALDIKQGAVRKPADIRVQMAGTKLVSTACV